MRAATCLVLGSIAVLTACQDLTEPADPSTYQAARVDALAQEIADQSALARVLPAFGGFFIDEAGRPTAYLTDVAQAGALRARIHTLAGMEGHSPAELVVLQGNFPYAQLETAFDRATHAAMPLAGSVFTDLDETRNQVVVGVEHAGLVTGARAALARAGLPDGSYDVVVSDPIYHVATLRDRFDPTLAGIQLHFSQYVCTLGANVLDGTDRSFITNSHCTAKQGGVESTVYYQPTSSVDGTVIATEVEDPTYFKGGACPRGKQCRRSDSSRARYSSARNSTLGGIAVTTGPNNGSLTYAGTYSVSGKGSVSVGATVNKVGRTTGWTQAPVTRTCVNTSVSGSNIMQLCQNWVQHSSRTLVAGGDSGSGVWTGSGSNVVLVGLLWGGSSDGHTFIFSPWNQVEQELGVMTVK